MELFLVPKWSKERKEREKERKIEKPLSLSLFRLLFIVLSTNTILHFFCTALRKEKQLGIQSLVYIHSNYRARITSIIKSNFLIKLKLFGWLSKFTISNCSSFHLILILCKKYFFKVIESCQKFLIQDKRKMKMAESINYFYLFRINSE